MNDKAKQRARQHKARKAASASKEQARARHTTAPQRRYTAPVGPFHSAGVSLALGMIASGLRGLK